ncbi:transposase-like zinc-binding domain-containing protein [Nostoc sp.]
MECPKCSLTHIRKNGKQRGKQKYIIMCSIFLVEM